MLSKILSSKHVEELNNIDNGLIGVIVCKEAQLTSKKHKRERVKRQTFLGLEIRLEYNK